MKEYIVPNYYDKFKCKCGDCRNSCCKGWNITISLEEYFHLESLECSKKLRKDLDYGLKIVENPTKERYAVLSSNYLGECYLHDKDGYCKLQKEKGEKVLPSICRLYPRSFCNSYHPQACISNSCEKVIELFIDDIDKITFKTMNLDFHFNDNNSLLNNDINQKWSIQQFFLKVLMNRDYTICKRIKLIGLIIVDISIISFDEIMNKYQNKEYNPNINSNTLIDYEYVYKIQNDVFEILGKRSPSLSIYYEEIKSYYNLESIDLDNQVKKFIDATNCISNIKFTNPEFTLEILIEKVLVNHLFYTSFPYEKQGDKFLSFNDQYLALVETYAFMDFIIGSYMINKIDKEDSLNYLVDIISSTYRLVEHSNFVKNIDIILEEEDCNTFDKINKLLLER